MVASRVLIVEDHELLAQSLALALQAEDMDVELVLARTDNSILEAVERFKPELVLLDLQLEGEVGVSTRLILPITQVGARVVILTGVTDRIALAECVEAGAVALASKAEGFQQLVELVNGVAAGDRGVERNERDELLGELRTHRESQKTRLEPFSRLTPREETVLAGLVDGKPAEAIAEEAVVSLATVRSQIRAVLLKLGVTSQLAAVALARRVGWQPTTRDNEGRS